MIQFNDNNRPICAPTDAAECKLNNAALQDVWDALKCFSEQYVLTDVKCFNFAGLTGETNVLQINKEDAPSIGSTCLIDFKWNGVQYYESGEFTEDKLNYTIDEEELYYNINLFDNNGNDFYPGSEDEPCDIRITVFLKRKVLDLFNACEETENCRDED